MRAWSRCKLEDDDSVRRFGNFSPINSPQGVISLHHNHGLYTSVLAPPVTVKLALLCSSVTGFKWSAPQLDLLEEIPSSPILSLLSC